jgi:hypothetical protein
LAPVVSTRWTRVDSLAYSFLPFPSLTLWHTDTVWAVFVLAMGDSNPTSGKRESLSALTLRAYFPTVVPLGTYLHAILDDPAAAFRAPSNADGYADLLDSTLIGLAASLPEKPAYRPSAPDCDMRTVRLQTNSP